MKLPWVSSKSDETQAFLKHVSIHTNTAENSKLLNRQITKKINHKAATAHRRSN